MQAIRNRLASSAFLIGALIAPAFTAGGQLTAQLVQHEWKGDDERDVIELKNGKKIEGRVLNQYDPSETIVMQGRKRVRLKPGKIDRMTTVRDKLRAFFERREGHDHESASLHWELCQWAHSQELYHLARVEAYAVLARDENHVNAHTYLEHKESKGKWRWRLDGRLTSKKNFDRVMNDIGKTVALRSEAFSIRTDAGLRKATDALLDAERLHLWWLDEYGNKLELDEILEPLPIKAYAERDDFPGLSSQTRAYFLPNPHNEKSFVFFEEHQDRPTEFFTTLSQHILYNSLARDADPGAPQARFCDWLEIGIGQWAESCFRGRGGEATPGEARLDPRQAAITLAGDRYSLKNMIHLTLRDHFYTAGSMRFGRGRDARRMRPDVHWAAVHCFTTYLLDENANPGMARRVWEYLYTALRLGRGDSSSAFDDAFGKEIEEFEKPWLRWLQGVAASAPIR